MNLRATKQGVSGQIMLEFLLVAPVLLTITGATIEVANFMRLSQISTVVSQEAANQAYRQCSSIVRLTNPADPRYSTAPGTVRMQIDDTATPVAVQACLENVRANTLSTLNNLNQNTNGNAVHLMVARFYQRGTSNPVQSFEATTIESTEAGDDKSSHRKPLGTGLGTGGGRERNRAFEKKASCNRSNGNLTYESNTATPITIISGAELQKREQVIVGQAVAGYTPLVKFFNLKIIYSGEFRAVTVM